MSGLQYRDTWYKLAPPWLRTGVGEKFMYTMQLCTDLLVEKAMQAVAIRLPGQGDPSQLPYLANDRGLIQGPAETAAQFVLRLQGAFAAWKKAGSAQAVAGQLLAYLQGLQPGVPATNPLLSIISGSYPSVTKWVTQYVGDAVGTAPSVRNIIPGNFNWDGKPNAWRAWLVLYMTSVQVAAGDIHGAVASVAAGSWLGQNVGGVWVPGTSGTPVNYPWATMAGLSGLSSSNVGQWLVCSGAAHAGNNGTFPIVQVTGSGSCVVANPNAFAGDTGITWSIVSFPFIAPGMPWGAGAFMGTKIGQGENLSTTPPSTPPLDTGSNVGGVWQPTTTGTYGCTLSWGLSCTSGTIGTIRTILKRWKSAATYYPKIVVAFDGAGGAAGSAYSPNSSPGSGNPDGTFGSVGKLVAGVWVPARSLSSPFDAYCQGTGQNVSCGVENVT